jgi:hypothetical protein
MSGASLFGAKNMGSSIQTQQSGQQGRGLFGNNPPPSIGRGHVNAFGSFNPSPSASTTGGLFGALSNTAIPTYRASTTHQSRQYYGPTEVPESTTLFGGLAAAMSKRAAPPRDWSQVSSSEKVLALIALQAFDGYWPGYNAEVGRIMGLGSTIKNENLVPEEKNIWATLLVVKFLEEKCADEEGTWALVVEKARTWLASMGNDPSAMDELEKKALGIVQKSPVSGGYAADDDW